jgi:hypothetical protein
MNSAIESKFHQGLGVGVAVGKPGGVYDGVIVGVAVGKPGGVSVGAVVGVAVGPVGPFGMM